MAYIPFQNTKISVVDSASKIMAMLSDTGFDETAQVNKSGEIKIYALYKGAEFQFVANITGFVDKLPCYKSENRKERARQCAWAFLRSHVKMICDSIKLGMLSPMEGFSGYLLLNTKDGPVPMAEVLIQQIESGTFKKTGTLDQLFIEHKPAEKERG